MDSLEYLKTEAMPRLEKVKVAYYDARKNEIAMKQLFDQREKESFNLRGLSKSETAFNNAKREFIIDAKNEYEDAKEKTKEIIKRFEMLKEVINLHKFIANNATEQIKISGYKEEG